jgi:hypothetical protein
MRDEHTDGSGERSLCEQNARAMRVRAFVKREKER